MLIGKSVEEKIWNYLKSNGLNDFGVAALMGNLYAESGLRSNNLQDAGNRKLDMTDDEYTVAVDNGLYTKEQFVYDKIGYGICQHTFWSRKKALYEYAKNNNASIGDLEIQLEYLMTELKKDYSSVLKTLKNATSLLEASNEVLFKFESPSDQGVSVQNQRASYGQKYYDKYATNSTANTNKGDGSNMSYTKGKAVKLSNNFKSTEFDCHGNGCCSVTYIDEKLVKYLQKIRDHFKKPITINSGYRCPSHNKSIGGASNSRHAKGMAADIVVKGVTPKEVAKYAESIGVLGIGLYEKAHCGDDFVHIDTRTTKSFWYGHSQEKRTTFGGSSSKNNTTVKNNESTKTTKVDSAQSFSKSLAGNYKTITQLNMRVGAGTSKSVLAVLPRGAIVTCYGYYTVVNNAKWLYVKYKSADNSVLTGFVSSSYLKKLT